MEQVLTDALAPPLNQPFIFRYSAPAPPLSARVFPKNPTQCQHTILNHINSLNIHAAPSSLVR